jgi:subtilisin family serine protease
METDNGKPEDAANTGQENKTNDSGNNGEVERPQVVSGAVHPKRHWRSPRIILPVVLGVAVLGTAAILLTHALTSEPTPAPASNVAQPTFNVALPNPPYVPDAVLLKFKAGVPQAVQDKLIARYGTLKKDLPQIGIKEITVPEEARDAVINALSHNPAIDFAVQDRLITATDTIPNDPGWNAEWEMTKMQTPKAWDTTTGSPSVTVAVLDTGVDYNHEDLRNVAFTTGYNFISNNTNTTDDNGHGTSVAGVIGATANNSLGLAGACWHCTFMPVKIMDSNGGGSDTTLAQGIDYAADHGAKIISMSLVMVTDARTASRTATASAIKYAESKGVSLYAAAGNSGDGTMQYWPAGFNGVVGVAGSDMSDNLYSWSDYGNWVTLAAAGCDFTTVIGGGYGTMCGTSAATPVAAGMASLLWSAKPTATAAQVQQALTSTTDPCCSGKLANGRINVYKAMQAILGTSTSADTTAPTASITAPAGGTTVSGQTTVSVNAADNIGVSKVELYKNGALYATATTAPYNFFWDTTTTVNGSYSLTAKAYDAAGNLGTSTAVSVTVSNTATGSDTVAPVATISNPTSDVVVSGKVSVNASATDNIGVVEMDVYIDGVLKTTSTSGSVSYSWNTNGNGTKKGTHTITVKAYDAAGNVGTATVTVTK